MIKAQIYGVLCSVCHAELDQPFCPRGCYSHQSPQTEVLAAALAFQPVAEAASQPLKASVDHLIMLAHGVFSDLPA